MEQNLKISKLFCGEPEVCGGFILQCQLAFQRAPLLYSTDAVKISYLVSQLKGEVLRWAHACMSSHPINSLTFSLFLEEFLCVSDQHFQQAEAVKFVLTIWKSRRVVMVHALEFWITATHTEWGVVALRGTFLHSLSERINDHLVLEMSHKVSMNWFILLHPLIVNCRTEGGKETTTPRIPPLPGSAPWCGAYLFSLRGTPLSKTPSLLGFIQRQAGRWLSLCYEPKPEPVQLGWARLSTKEQRQRINTITYHFISKAL